MSDLFNLAPKYLDDVIGQERLIGILKTRLAQVHSERTDQSGNEAKLCNHQRKPLMLVGPRHSGKKTIARLYAQGLLCKSAEGPDRPCCECKECKVIGQGHTTLNYTEMKGGHKRAKDEKSFIVHRWSDEEMRDKVQDMRRAVNSDVVFVIDGPEDLTPSASDVLLKRSENAGLVSLIFLVNEVHRVNAAIKSRCEVIECARIPHEDMVSYIRDSCRTRGLQLEDDVIDILADHANGWIGRAKAGLAAIAQSLPVNCEKALSVLGYGWGNAAVDAWRTLLRGDVDEALRHAEQLGGNAYERTAAIQTFLRTFYIRHRLGGGASDIAPALALAGISEETWQVIADEWASLAAKDGGTLEASVENALTFWSAERGEGLWEGAFARGAEIILYQ